MTTPEIEVKITPDPATVPGGPVVIVETPVVDKVEEIAAIVDAVSDLVPTGEIDALRLTVRTLEEKIDRLAEENNRINNDLVALAAAVIVEDITPEPEDEIIVAPGDLETEIIPEPAKEPELRLVKKSRFV